jgi:hypothetical protein
VKKLSVLIAISLMVMLLPLFAATPAQAVGGGTVSILQCKPGPVHQVDPILNPGGAKSGHVHQFWGGKGIQPEGTTTTVNQMQTSGTTCPLSADTAGYWVPTLHRADGTEIKPTSMNVYYRSPSGQEVRPFAEGFGLVCGMDPRPECMDTENVTSWACDDAGREPSIQAALPCPKHLKAHVFMRSTDPTLPKVALHVRYPITNSCPGCYISSDMGAEGGTTLHGDFWNTWDQNVLRRVVATLNAGKTCAGMTDAKLNCLRPASESPPAAPMPTRVGSCPGIESTAVTPDDPVVGSIEACGSGTNNRVQVIAKKGSSKSTIFDKKPVTLTNSPQKVGMWALSDPGNYEVISKILRNGSLVAKSSLFVEVSDSSPPPPPGGSVDIAAAGDIATSGSGDTATSNLVLDLNPTQVYTLGDNVYPDGTLGQFNSYYDPTWGRFLAKTFPTVGNHDYHTAGASGYKTYFAPSAGNGDLLNYSHMFEGWLVVHLDSEGSTTAAVNFLNDRLAASSATCEIVMWHHPRFSSGEHGNDASQASLWDAAVAGDVELVLNGHDHNYERFAPVSGTEQLVVGTGGVGLRAIGTPEPGSQVRLRTHGVLALDVTDTGYSFEFIDTANVVQDSGSGSCN